MSPERVPFRRTQVVLAAMLAVLCLVGLVTIMRGGSPREWVREHYALQSHDASTGRDTLVSQEGVTQTAARIRSAWKPADQIVDPTGVFLRYSDLIIAIQHRTDGGATIYLDDEDHGYSYWYGHVGGDWGTGSPVSSVRGGGPGSGK